MYLGAAGMVSAVGLDAKSACAALRAGVAGFNELPYWDERTQPVIGAAVPGVSFDLQGTPRLVELLAVALKDCLTQALGIAPANIPLLVGLAELGRPGSSESRGNVLSLVQEKLGVKFHPGLSRVIPTGHAAGIEALNLVRDYFRSGNITECLVCGVDSYINASSIFWLDRSWRLKREGHNDGVIPGEAAAAILVRKHALTRTESGVQVAGLGFATETVNVFSEEPFLGIGLASAGRQALNEAAWGFHDLEFRITDLTGETYGFREHALMEGRLARKVRKEPQPLWHAADSIGDTGAAVGVIELITGASAMLRGYGPGPRAGCFASSVPGQRAVALLQRVGP